MTEIDTQDTIVLNGEIVSRQMLHEKFNLPEDAEIVGCHVYATDSEEKIQLKRFVWALSRLGFEGFSGSAFSKLYGFESLRQDTIANIFCVDDDYIDDLRKIGFGPNEAISFVKEIKRLREKGVKLTQIIGSLAIDGCGVKIQKQFARELSGLTSDWSGLTKSVQMECVARQQEVFRIIQTLNDLSVKVIYEVDAETKTVAKRYLLTGSPKAFGFKTKDEFKATLPADWVEVGNIKEADMLVTDSLTSKSSKMTAATKLGKQIVTYDNVNA